MEYEIVRSSEEIDKQLNAAMDQSDKGGTLYSGETFETGMVQMLDWLTGNQDEPPLPVDEGGGKDG